MKRKISFNRIYFLKRVFHMIKHIPDFIKESYCWGYESCQECGNSFRVMWHVRDEIWNKVTGTNDGCGGSYCLDCFVKLAEKKGICIEPKDVRMDLFYPE